MLIVCCAVSCYILFCFFTDPPVIGTWSSAPIPDHKLGSPVVYCKSVQKSPKGSSFTGFVAPRGDKITSEHNDPWGEDTFENTEVNQRSTKPDRKLNTSNTKSMETVLNNNPFDDQSKAIRTSKRR